jgi:hypothetical protein
MLRQGQDGVLPGGGRRARGKPKRPRAACAQCARTAPSSWGVIYPEGDIVAVIDDCAEADRAVQALEAAGISDHDIFLIEGRRAVEIMQDYRQHQHVLGRIGRAISELMSDSSRFSREYLDEARKNHHLLVMHAPSAEVVDRVRPVLRAHRAHHVRYYGSLAIEDLP